MKAEIKKLKRDILQDVQDLNYHSNQLRKIVLLCGRLNAPNYIQHMIEVERKSKKFCNLNRIQFLEDIKKTA